MFQDSSQRSEPQHQAVSSGQMRGHATVIVGRFSSFHECQVRRGNFLHNAVSKGAWPPINQLFRVRREKALVHSGDSPARELVRSTR
jgi:hypothetical protein